MYFPFFMCKIPTFIHLINILKVTQITNRFQCNFLFVNVKFLITFSKCLHSYILRTTEKQAANSLTVIQKLLCIVVTYSFKTDNFAVKTKKSYFVLE